MKKSPEDRKFKVIHCGRCGTCCSEPVVPVTDSDVLRICKATGKKASDFVRFYSDEEMNYDPESGIWIQLDSGKMAMGLKKRSDRCIFLSPTICCRVYQSRPMTCRTFPYMIDFDENGDPEKVHMNRIVDCKSMRKGLSYLDAEVSNVRIEINEDDAYYAKIAIWNKRPKAGTGKDFIKFLGLDKFTEKKAKTKKTPAKKK